MQLNTTSNGELITFQAAYLILDTLIARNI